MSGFAGLAVYSGLNGFFGSALAFIRPLTIQELCGRQQQVAPPLANEDDGSIDDMGYGKTNKHVNGSNEIELLSGLVKNGASEEVQAPTKEIARKSNSDDNLPSLFGLFNLIVGVGNAVIPASAGAVIDAAGSIAVTFLYNAGGHFVGALALTLAVFLSRKNRL